MPIKKNAREIIEGYQKDAKIPLYNIDAIIDELFSKNGFYSNGQIIETIKTVNRKTAKPTKKDYIEEFQQTKPLITNRDIINYDSDKKTLQD